MRTEPAPLQRLQLPDGRTLGYSEYGDPAGAPVIYCHGFPASRLEAGLTADAAAGPGLRIIAADRPGYGGSDFRPGRSICEWTDDVAVLADHLGLERFRVLGVSGGGPYALACAARFADRVPALALVCGLGAMDDPQATRSFATVPRLMIDLARRSPRSAFSLYRFVVGPLMGRFPKLARSVLTAGAPAADFEVLGDPAVAGVIDGAIREAFRRGARGVACDLILYTRPWDFRLDDIRTPGSIWHGEADGTVPVAMGQRHARALPHLRTHWLPDEGHFSLPVRHMMPILRALRAQGAD